MREPVALQSSRATIFKMKIVMITLLTAKSQKPGGAGGAGQRSHPGCQVLKSVTPPGTSDEGLTLDPRGKNNQGPLRVSPRLPAAGKSCPITHLAMPPAHLHFVEVVMHHSHPIHVPAGQNNAEKQ
uniref:Uncharacterized protein n=1 Tax=Mandrillus leucophaeus TaxID=9568 RepID=A0A2K5XIM8_MANLE